MKLHPVAIGTAVVLASCLATGAATTSAFAADAPPAASTATKGSTSVITDVTQTPHSDSGAQYVVVKAFVSASADVRLLDGAGEVLDVESATAEKPAWFWIKPTGEDTAHFTLDVAGQGTRAVDIDFSAMPLSAPADQTTDREAEQRERQIRHGVLDHDVRYEALPGATVTVEANGQSHDAVADQDGIATVRVHFVQDRNEVTARQQLGAKRSEPAVDVWDYSEPGAGGGGGGEQGGGEQGAGEQVDPASFAVDVANGATLPVENGIVTLSGKASAGFVTVDGSAGPLGTAEVHDGRWTLDARIPDGDHTLVFELAERPGGRAVAHEVRSVTVGVPGGGGEQGGGEQGAGEQVEPASFAVDVANGATLPDENGIVTLSGKASAGFVTVDGSAGPLGTAEVHDGRWTLETRIPDGDHTLVFELAEQPGGRAVAHEVRSVTVGDVVDPGTPDVPLAIDQSGTVQLDADGFATFTGTAPGRSVLVLVNGKRAGEFAVTGGHFTAELYQRPGTYKVTFLAKSKPTGSAWDVVRAVDVALVR